MRVTDQLVHLYRVDCQLIGLKSRLRAAEVFLSEQQKQLGGLDAKRATLEADLKKTKAQAMLQESEVKRMDERIATLRDRMNNASTNKEYKATLTEINEIKVERDKAESSALTLMSKADELASELANLSKTAEERGKIRDVAQTDRAAKAEEIRERVEALGAERLELAAKVAADALRIYDRLLKDRENEAMAPLHELDRKAHEYTCGSCMMLVPVDVMSGLLSSGRLTTCPSCSVLLYVEEKLAGEITSPKAAKGRKRKSADVE